MSNLENAQLILPSYILSTTQTPNGITTNGLATMTWDNINLRTLLGEMYDRYDLFNLSLNAVATAKITTTVGAIYNTAVPPVLISAGFATNDYDNLNVLLNITGLPFINQGYNCKTGYNTPSTTLGTFVFPSTANSSSTQLYYGSSCATFGKNQETCSLTISYTRIMDGNLAVTPTAYPYPNIVFVFDIFGIDKKVDNKNSTRMI